MAYATTELIDALRETAKRLKNGASYSWGNHGACNCGNLLQVITSLSKEEILQFAHSGKGEWTELADDYCSVSKTPVDMLLQKLQAIGLTPTDIHHLEYLDDKTVLKELPGGFRWLKRNKREDVIIYFETFAQQLENKLIKQVNISLEELLGATSEPVFV